jgi:2-dehydropantoate 2-reductase
MITVFGAGAIGLTLAARLSRAGHAVRVCTRRAEDSRVLERGGIAVEEPATGAAWRAPVSAHAGPPIGERDWLFVCVRGPQTAAAAAAIAATSPEARVVNVQNGVDGDAVCAERFARVIGAVIRQGCTRVAADSVRAVAGGRIAVGLHPGGADAELAALADLLRGAAYDVGVSERIGADRWLKLCVNLMSTPNALVRPDEHDTAAFGAGKARLLEEARDVLRAAGIAARSCDGRDPSLDDEIERQRSAFARGVPARRLPIYNSLWQALRRGSPLEADGYHARIIALGRRHGVATPTNERALAAVERVVAEALGPESLGTAEVFGDAA